MQLRASLLPEHMRFLTSLKTSLTIGRYFLCHAGVRPGVPLENQSEEDLLWIRDEFLNSTMNFGKIAGATPNAELISHLGDSMGADHVDEANRGCQR